MESLVRPSRAAPWPAARLPACAPAWIGGFSCDRSIRGFSPALRLLMLEYPHTIIALRYGFVLSLALDHPGRG
jgi:hypothetical protein